MDCINIPTLSLRKLARGNVRAKATMLHNSITIFKSISSLNNNNGVILGTKSKLKSSSDLNAKFIHTLNLIGLKSENNSDISATLLLSGVFHARLKSNSQLSIPYTDKLGGSFDLEEYRNFKCREKLYPTQDIVTSSGNNYFVNEDLETSGLYNSIDEGIFTTQYDDKNTYIQPWSTYSSGNFKYTFNVSNPLVRPRESLLLIRASAPRHNDSSFTTPIYKINNITFEDPSGNLIIKYKDFVIRGDANYDEEYVNFATYITEPEINNSALDTWDNNYPVLGSGTFTGNYKVNIDITIESLDDPFDDGYNEGYEDRNTFNIIDQSGNNYLALDGAPLSTQTQGFINPENTLRITAIELCNSGELSSFRNNYVPFYTDVLSTGLRVTRNIFPSQVLNYDHTNNIYPPNSSKWISSISNNLTTNNALKLLPLIRDENNSTYILLDYSSINDSGKLQLKFSHQPPVAKDTFANGAFNFGNYIPTLPFNNAKWSNVADTDNFFTIDDIELKIVARKATGSRNYSLDVVGYSDDKLLHITSQVGGFLQNIENSGGAIPTSSGFANINDLGISSESISDKYQYFENNLTNNQGGDHYLLSTNPIISGTSFEEYTIPLKIYEDRVNLGKSIDYSMSSYFENLYLDIYPIPSGASISKIWLVVKYKPSNGLMLHTIGQADKEFAKRQVRLLPNGDTVNTSGSLINNIPHGYTRDSTLKNNYGRRWKKAHDSLFAGPYDPKEFDFSFYNPQMYSPFLNGYFSFIHDSGNSVIADYSYNRSRLDTVVSGSYIGKYDKVNNLGLRFNSTSLFSQSTTNKTIDWTRISGYTNHELYGRITDNFENAVRVSGNLGYINFGNIVTSNGFAVYTRFSPDINISGVGYNLWNSGVIFSKYDNGNNLEFIVGFKNGKLIGTARDNTGNFISVNDSKYYYDYTYPLDIMLSYNENDNKLRLFTDSLRDTSTSFILHSGNNNLTFGYSSGSGIGINVFLTNIGISTNSGINILSSGTKDITSKQLLYSDLNNNLYDSINERIDNWHLGAYKICAFNHEYDRFTKREGSGVLLHHINHNGSGYTQITNLTLPTGINSNEVAYHTQIENDFIRFNLQDTSEANPNFYSTYPRICKTLPRGYKFTEDAFVVDTIINYETYNDIMWSDNNIGPKLIVSLYTPNKEPISYPTTNYGLINRYIHYLKPSGCWQTISSKFDFNSLIDESEPWANFNKDQYLNEFNHKYFSKDIDDMFLQYDLVYPSGKSFESILKIYGVNVRLENSLVTSSGINNNINLSVSGENVSREYLNLNMPNTVIPSSEYINLYANANISGVSSGIFNLSCSGALLSSGYMPLHSLTIGSLSNIDPIFGSFGSAPNFGINLYTSGQLFREEDFPLFLNNNILDQSSSGVISLICFSSLPQYNIDDIVNLRIRGRNIPVNTAPSSSMNLYTVSPRSVTIDTNFNLFISSFDQKIIDTNISLFIVNRPLIGVESGSDVISWNNKNTGLEITVSDNIYSSLSANDEIRGVELICYGDCQ
jgi:hypothetical protein